MLSSPTRYWPVLPAVGLLALPGGWWFTRPRSPAVPLRRPLPNVVRVSDGLRSWKVSSTKIGLDPVARSLDLSHAAREIKAVADEAGVPARDARLVFVEGGGFQITRSRAERIIDVGASLHRLVTYATAAAPPPDFQLVVRKKPPRISTGELKKIEGPVAGFTTTYHSSDWGRTRNLQLVTERLNGAVVMPGKVFSFNDRVGPRDESGGFQIAHIYVHGKIIKGLGGGTCQVSSTLYNAALLSGMKIAERNTHSITVPYVPPGRDATVYYGERDFKFRNPTAAPVYIRASAGRGTMQVTLYGAERTGPKIELASRVERRGDKVYARVLRLFRVGGTVVRRERLSSDVYTPLDVANREAKASEHAYSTSRIRPASRTRRHAKIRRRAVVPIAVPADSEGTGSPQVEAPPAPPPT